MNKLIIAGLLLWVSAMTPASQADTGKTYEQVRKEAHSLCISYPKAYYECMAGYMAKQGYKYEGYDEWVKHIKEKGIR